MKVRRLILNVQTGFHTEDKGFVWNGEPLISAEIVTEDLWRNDEKMGESMARLINAHRKPQNIKPPS